MRVGEHYQESLDGLLKEYQKIISCIVDFEVIPVEDITSIYCNKQDDLFDRFLKIKYLTQMQCRRWRIATYVINEINTDETKSMVTADKLNEIEQVMKLIIFDCRKKSNCHFQDETMKTTRMVEYLSGIEYNNKYMN